MNILPDIQVLDLSRVFAGPWAGQMLADFGADVIKVEHPAGGDDVRRMGLPQTDAAGRETGETSSYLAMNRGKRSITIDISKPAGQELVRRMAERADVMIENFKTGTAARYGLDYPAVAALNPRVVYCSITGFGQSGPYSHLPGYDPLFQAMSGLMSITGVPGGEPGAGPNLVGFSVSDITAGLYASIAILAALHHRDTVSGRGQYIDLALLDAQVAALSHMAMNYLVSGRVPARAGAASQITCPWQAFACADMSIVIAVGTDQQFTHLCAVLGRPELAEDQRFVTNRARLANKAALIPLLAGILAQKSAGEWLRALAAAGVPSSPLNNLAQVCEDPQLRHRGMLIELPHPLAGTMRAVANPIRFSATPIEYHRPPPLHGEHTREVLREKLGLHDAELDTLARNRII